MFTERITVICDDHEIGEATQKSIITDAQLRALNRKHLLMMIRDLEKELEQEKNEKENLLTVCRAIAAQRQRTDKVVGENEKQ